MQNSEYYWLITIALVIFFIWSYRDPESSEVRRKRREKEGNEFRAQRAKQEEVKRKANEAALKESARIKAEAEAVLDKKGEEKLQAEICAVENTALENQLKEGRIKQVLDVARLEQERLIKEHSRVQSILEILKRELPFFCSNDSASLSYGDKKRFELLEQVIKEGFNDIGTLYYVKIKSLLDDKEYFKIGFTKKSINERFEKSTQVELLEVICTFTNSLYIILFLEFILIREFKITETLMKNPVTSAPEEKFSGSSEVVRHNSETKLIGIFKKLGNYAEQVNSEVNKL